MIKKMYCAVASEQMGKTFWLKNLGLLYPKRGGCFVVYNVGRDSDFPDSDFIEIKPLSFVEHLKYIYTEKDQQKFYKLDKKIEYFFYQNKIYHFRNFLTLFAGKSVKIYRLHNSSEENAIFQTFYNYLHSSFLMIDDSLHIVGEKPSDNMLELFSRKNHTGKLSNVSGNGLDISLVYHSIDTITKKVWIYITDLVMLKCISEPTFYNVNRDEYKQVIQYVHERLQNAEKHTAYKIDFRQNYLQINDVSWR